MTLAPYFSSSSKVWEDISWVYGIEEAGYQGWEIVADGNYRLDLPESFKRIREVIETTRLKVTVHAPFGDLNLATLNDPIREESIQQLCTCITYASELTETVTIHPGYLSPIGKLLPDKAWQAEKDALVKIGKHASDHSVTACLENMIGIKEFLCRLPDELAGMTEGIEGIGMTFDIGHANTIGKVPDFLERIGLARHVHVHDNHGESDEHLALGAGTINWKMAGKKIASSYSGIVVVEGRSLAEAKASLEIFRRYFA
jgi:sugar phosphate isomerase/epimerase